MIDGLGTPNTVNPVRHPLGKPDLDRGETFLVVLQSEHLTV